jgi:hypothetical protein
MRHHFEYSTPTQIKYSFPTTPPQRAALRNMRPLQRLVPFLLKAHPAQINRFLGDV